MKDTPKFGQRNTWTEVREEFFPLHFTSSFTYFLQDVHRGGAARSFAAGAVPSDVLPVAENEARALKSTEIEAKKGLNIFEASALPASNRCCQARQVNGLLPLIGGKQSGLPHYY